MCLESNTPRALAGGAIATLHPRNDISSSSALDRLATYKLHLRNDTSNSTQPRTIATLISPTFAQPQTQQRPSFEGYRVVIQRDGDLTTTTTSSSPPPMHSFQFSASAANSSPTLELDTAMDLSVGGEGLIGRRVQLVEVGGSGQSETGRVLREGVLGWN